MNTELVTIETVFLRLVSQERTRQDAKWGKKPGVTHHRDTVLLSMNAVIAEEFGEVARAILELRAATARPHLDDHLENLRDELVQLAACCCALWEQTYHHEDIIEASVKALSGEGSR
jgi:NTP pyrophosphatase (non-canonical NTP hydrolase)